MGKNDSTNSIRGRPFGHRLSEETKNKIRDKRVGTHHSRETRDKISKSLTEYFKSRDSLADSIAHEYNHVSEKDIDWIYNNREAIDSTEYVVTEKRLSYLKQVELSFGGDIEHLFGHNATPEFLLLVKEEIIDLLGEDGVRELCSLL